MLLQALPYVVGQRAGTSPGVAYPVPLLSADVHFSHVSVFHQACQVRADQLLILAGVSRNGRQVGLSVTRQPVDKLLFGIRQCQRIGYPQAEQIPATLLGHAHRGGDTHADAPWRRGQYL